MGKLEQVVYRTGYGLVGFSLAWIPLFILCSLIKDPEVSTAQLLVPLAGCTFLVIAGSSMVVDAILGEESAKAND